MKSSIFYLYLPHNIQLIMKILFTVLFLLFANRYAAAQPYDKDFTIIKDQMVKDGFTFMKTLTREGLPHQGMIVEQMNCIPGKEYGFVGIQVHRPDELHAVILAGVPGAGSRVKNQFTPTERITENGYDIYTCKAGIINNSGNPDCMMDIYFYDSDYESDPAYILVFEKPVK